MPENKQTTKTLPPQVQDRQPGIESEMNPRPEFETSSYKAAGKLLGKAALITGGDSGIGRAVAVHFAKEGADVVISYLNEHSDAEETKRQVEQEGRKCILIAGDIGVEAFCQDLINRAVEGLGKLDILINNAAEQHPQDKIEDITSEQLERTFRTNIFSMFYLTKAAMPHLKKGSTIINTTSITAYRGSPQLLDYSSTKGAILSFTRSLSMNLAEKGIRVNAVAPGPIWTPLIPSTFDAKKVSEFGGTQPMQRPGQPEELAPAYVYLASDDSSYVSGQVMHVNGGEIVNG
ncbi:MULTISPECIES: SDR family oxidoreductase [unclassified Paenibacillus]|uniref:SDR family oxidoreductase n=1 Tax=unclassified Paenibacillus TaxID=185978 RepID=UPI00093BD7BD|nr:MULTISPECIES: SDR family oxidoreductase [unclassified Paenibacillus]OKP93465.1 NAD(P)-dependent oxidoreductase [Paenibacillus sp. P32E]OKP98341.1 NAD(P)-dependent oxidoreductase [Paenibacillus sp. P46E]